MLARIIDQSRARVEVPQPPRRDDFDTRLERIISQLEAYLIVALAGGTVGNRVGLFFHGDVDLPLGDQRPGDRSAEQIRPFINRVGAQHRKNVIFDKLLAQIADHHFARAGLDRLAFDRLKIFALPQVGAKRDHFAAILLFKPA